MFCSMKKSKIESDCCKYHRRIPTQSLVLYKVPCGTKCHEVREFLDDCVGTINIVSVLIHTPTNHTRDIITSTAFVELSSKGEKEKLLRFYEEEFESTGMLFTNQLGKSSHCFMSRYYESQHSSEHPSNSKPCNETELNIKNYFSDSRSAGTIISLVRGKSYYEYQRKYILAECKKIESVLMTRSNFFSSEHEFLGLQRKVSELDAYCVNLENIINKSKEKIEDIKKKLRNI